MEEKMSRWGYLNDHGENPFKIQDPDPLLEKLFECHGNRRYDNPTEITELETNEDKTQ
jgi:hypothetical protein